MNFATLRGSFSSTLPNDDGSAMESSRLSSERGMAKRDMRRSSLQPPQCWHTSSTFSLTRKVRIWERRRQSRQRYS